MANPIDLSKAAQEQILAVLKQSQEVALSSVELLVKNATAFTTAPALSKDAPTPEQLVANSFGFAEKLLASQKEFAQKVVAVAAPVFEKATPAAK
jgi:hypothetical protein